MKTTTGVLLKITGQRLPYILFFILLLQSPLLAQNSSLSDQALAAYNAHRYAESAALYRQALSTQIDEIDRSDAEYRLACSEALARQSTAALADLASSVRDGFAEAAQIGSDPDLASLHADPRFAEIILAAKAAVALDDRRWGTAAFKTAYSSNLSDADKLAGLSLVWAEGKFSFGNAWHVPDLDWDKLYRATIPQALATHTTYEYYRVLQHFMAQLHDGHSTVYMPDPLDSRTTADSAAVPFQIEKVGDHVYVTRLLGTDADRQGIQVGDEITQVNGELVRQWAEREVEPYQSASTPQDLMARTYGAALFDAPPGKKFRLTVKTAAGRTRVFDFTTCNFQAAVPPFEFRMLSGNIAYAALNEFGDDEGIKQWDAHWPELSKANGIILDLRRNGGGSDDVGFHVLATLIDRPVPSSLVRANRWVASLRAWGRIQTPMTFPVQSITPGPQRHFAGPVVMLVGPHTYSAGEDMVVAFRSAHRGTIIGEPTGGSTGQPLMFDLPGGGMGRVCTLHDSFADGTEFVGAGVAPNVLVSTTVSDVMGVADTAITRAEMELHGPSAR